jgi:hypothetical protein
VYVAKHRRPNWKTTEHLIKLAAQLISLIELIRRLTGQEAPPQSLPV